MWFLMDLGKFFSKFPRAGRIMLTVLYQTCTILPTKFGKFVASRLQLVYIEYGRKSCILLFTVKSIRDTADPKLRVFCEIFRKHSIKCSSNHDIIRLFQCFHLFDSRNLPSFHRFWLFVPLIILADCATCVPIIAFVAYPSSAQFKMSASELINITNKNNVLPPFLEYSGETSFFGGNAPLPVGVGYAVVLGFGILFSLVTTCLVIINGRFGKMGEITSEHFK